MRPEAAKNTTNTSTITATYFQLLSILTLKLRSAAAAAGGCYRLANVLHHQHLSESVHYRMQWALYHSCPTYYFISCHPARYTLDLAARSLLLLLCCPLTDIHCSIFISRWLMLAAIPILRCSLLAYPRSLLTDYCSLSLLAADFSLLAGLYSLHAAHCHTYAKSAKKKGSANPSTQNS